MRDLHIHSSYSDGDRKVSDLVSELKEKDFDLFSITDHDSVESLSVLDSISGICYIPGVEMSSEVDGVKVHILGYGICDSGSLRERCLQINDIRKHIILEILEGLIKKGYHFTEQDLDRFIGSNSSNLSKVDISKCLVKNGYAKTVSEAFYGILDEYKVGRFYRTPANQVIELIHGDGGLAVLAHPFESIPKQKADFDTVVSKLCYLGLDGIEVFTTKHTEKQEDFLEEYCRERDLLISGGSDYHGPITKPNISLGDHVRGNKISEKILKKRIQH